MTVWGAYAERVCVLEADAVEVPEDLDPAVPIDYRNEDFLARLRELPERGVDVALDGLGGAVSIRSFRALRPAGRLVIYGHYAVLAQGRRAWRGWIEWYGATATVALWGLLSPRRRVLAYRIQKLREGRQTLPVGPGRRALQVGGGPRHPDWFREDARRAHELLESSAAKGKLVLVP